MTKMIISHRDEKAVVEYLLQRLEERLAGRHETEILNTLPSDHCQLGVLVPWSLDPNVPDDIPDADVSADGYGETSVEQHSPNTRSTAHTAASETQTPQPEVTNIEPFSAVEEAARRPPSSLGMGFALASEGDSISPVEIVISGKFAIYTRHFPSFEEQRRQLGSAPEATEGDRETSMRRRRREVSLIEKCKRHVIDIPPVHFILQQGLQARLTDDGTVQAAVAAALQGIEADSTIRRQFTGRQVIPEDALTDEAAYAAYLNTLTGSPELPPLRVSLRLRVQPNAIGQLRIEVYLCNDTPRDTIQPFNDQYRILGDASLEMGILQGTLVPAELLPVPEDYQYDRRVYVVGRNVSAEVSEDSRWLRTRALARYDQPRMTTSERVPASYAELSDKPFEVLERIRVAMLDYARDWRERVVGQNSLMLTPDELDACSTDLESFNEEIRAFASGIAALKADARLERAFRAMNSAFTKSKYTHWRLFQIVFIVTQLPALVVREGINSGEWPVGERLSWDGIIERADVLWFPTGGGKTEAYLGLISCAALYDRLRGKNAGVTAWLRFPLRMLSVQQLQRAMRVLWSTEIERRAMAEQSGDPDGLGDAISLGYLVGKANTPNQFRDGWSFANLKKDARLRERLLLIPDCPACGVSGSVDIRLDEPLRRARHVCKVCETELPVYVSDEEVYRFVPSLVVGTVDKMAAIAYQPKVAILWAGPEWRCSVPGHGYGSDDWCITGCPTNPKARNPSRIRRKTLASYDPAPSFHIQDELHLLQEELGAFAGHYETMVRSNEAAVSSMPSKVIAATATISGYEHQARHIYGVRGVRRFPNRGYDLIETFYSTTERDLNDLENRPKTMRVFSAFRPPYMRAADAAALCTEILHQAINELQSDPYAAVIRVGLQDATTEEEVQMLLGYYSRTLTYVGKRDSGSRIKDKLERDSSDETHGLKPAEGRELNIEYLASHSTLREIAETIKRAEADVPWKSADHLDATVATDVISHGVDVDRYNLMVLEKIPEQIAGYIQVSSRSGRQHVGLVLAVLPRYSLRASSIYDRFPEFHGHLDRMVTPVPVNRFAKTAIDRSFPGILLGTLYGRHLNDLHGSRQQRMNIVARALRDDSAGPVTDTTLLREILDSYALGDGVYDPALERQMTERLYERYERFKLDIRNPAYDDLPKVFEPGPMTSLRDVDVAVPFRPDDRVIDWRDLYWFQLRQ